MSIRPTNNTNTSRSSPAAAIDFKTEFTSSPAAVAANHDEAVNTILSRLDQLQAKINGENNTNSTDGSTKTTTATKSSVVRTTSPATNNTGDLHARLSSLESIHEGALNRLSSKVGEVEKRLAESAGSEHLMGKIVSKFSALETKLQAHAGLGERIQRLETQLKPDPMQEEMLHRINSKLDKIEDAQRKKGVLGSKATSSYRPQKSSSTEDEIRELQERVSALRTLRAKYDNEDE